MTRARPLAIHETVVVPSAYLEAVIVTQ